MKRLICALCALAMVLTGRSVLAGFTGGPSVRVSPNTSFDIRWIADFIGDGKVEIFDNANGGTPIDTQTTSASGNDHTIKFFIGGVLRADTNYFFKVTHKDPTGGRPDLTSDVPFPPVFTGAQTAAMSAWSQIRTGPSSPGTPTSSTRAASSTARPRRAIWAR